MPSTRKIIRAFLASPGDLQDERRAIREAVEEYNESWANELGYQVELIGWEETVAGFGRPQHLINQDLDRCDLFLGMIWKRWGTPPDNDGEFTSGFEEEFIRSVARCEKTGNPEISLFFKQIPDEFMMDPGDDLKKVLEFKKTIIADKKVLFQNFSTVRDMEKLARKCVTAYINRIRVEEESSKPNELRAKRAQSESGETKKEDMESQSSPLSVEGFNFLEGFVDKIRQPDSLDNLSASDVARFRLLAYSISKPGNESMNLGVHDINILYVAHTEGIELGDRERRCLVRLGFQHLANENVPLWCWYSALDDSHIDPAIVSSVANTNEKEQVGAISVLTALDHDLKTDNAVINREWIINDWFSDDSSNTVKIAALGYLAKCGTAKELEIVKKEYMRSDYSTSRSALECMVGILLRTGQILEAQKLVLESQFESLNTDLLRTVLDGFDGLETSELLLGLEHRSSQIRLSAMKNLHIRSKLNIGLAERLSEDSDVLIRREAIEVLNRYGKTLADDEVKKILNSPQKQPRSLLSGPALTADSDKMGEKLFKQYQLEALKSLSEAELEKRIEKSLLYEDDPYFALAERYFRNHVEKLRHDVDNRFKTYFENRIRKMETILGNNSIGQELIKNARNLEEYSRKELTRKGLNVLCSAQNTEDLQRIRTNLRDGYAEASILDAKYLGKHGEWKDILLLAKAQGPSHGVGILMIPIDEDFQMEVARAIISIGKKQSISDLLSLEIPAFILKKIIELCPESRFENISHNVLFALFNHESDGVRKATAILTVRSFTWKRIKSVLQEYIGSKKSQYYNVIHWLDLGATMSRDVVRKVARAAVSK
jgi:hypothetical protein